MAGLFDAQASIYAASRPDYPPSLFSFLSSLTPCHHRAWDVGTGNGQAAVALSLLYDQVIATDASASQLEHAQKRPNITYACTSCPVPEPQLQSIIGSDGSVDIITVAQALHWFDLHAFYAQAKRVLRKEGGVLAVWCYTEPSISEEVDAVFAEYYKDTGPFWHPARRIVDDEYRSIPFPFSPILKDDRGTGPIRFEFKKQMNVETFLTYLKSMSVLQCARKQGVELLDENRQDAFRAAWGQHDIRTVTWPIFLRVGTPNGAPQ